MIRMLRTAAGDPAGGIAKTPPLGGFLADLQAFAYPKPVDPLPVDAQPSRRSSSVMRR